LPFVPVPTSSAADVVVIGAGVVGASCAFYAARAGLRVTVLDRGPVAGGTTGAGEGNLLVSDKLPGPELDLALRSARLWREIADEVGGFEYEPKGGVVVAASESALADLNETSAGQRAAGVEAVPRTRRSSRCWPPHTCSPTPVRTVPRCSSATR
jgi:glycine/D-amino acid oxidase-like deaminating enzyme